MASRVVVRWNRIPNVSREAETQLDTIVEAMARDGERDVKESFTTSPSSPGEPPGVDTGTLRNSINVHKPRAKVRVIRDGVEYGVHLEYGTRRMAARPFFGPMARRLTDRVPEFFRDFLD